MFSIWFYYRCWVLSKTWVSSSVQSVAMSPIFLVRMGQASWPKRWMLKLLVCYFVIDFNVTQECCSLEFQLYKIFRIQIRFIKSGIPCWKLLNSSMFLSVIQNWRRVSRTFEIQLIKYLGISYFNQLSWNFLFVYWKWYITVEISIVRGKPG